jgi:bifunctional DNA primase/polymerase-like protein
VAYENAAGPAAACSANGARKVVGVGERDRPPSRLSFLDCPTTPVLIDAAMAYAAAGLPVFPCVPRGKRPAIPRGFLAASTNPETIRRYWRIPDRNIGIPTGSISGFWILDIDQPDGESSRRALEAKHGPLPATVEVITGSGGRHLWFRYTCAIQSTAARIAPGIDTRGDGGFVIAPPSIHETGRAYAWSVDSADQLAIAPDWLIGLTRRKISERALDSIAIRHSTDLSAYGRAALDREIAALAATAPGARNNALNVCAFRLFQLVAGGELDGHEVSERLVDASHRMGLSKTTACDPSF